MKIIPSILLLALVPIAAADDLKLADGRTFNDSRIVSETPTTVMVRHAQGAAKVEKKLLPPELLKQHPIDEKAAEMETAENVRGRAEYAAQANAAAEKRAREHEEFLAELKRSREQEEARTAQSDAAQRKMKRAQVSSAAGKNPVLTAIAEMARQRAVEYFESEYIAGSGQSLKFEIKTRLDAPRAVAGWPGRYEVTGVAWFEFFDSYKGGSFGNKRHYFSTDVRTGEDGSLRVDAIELRNGPSLR